MENMITAQSKPGKCPACGWRKISTILYGLPAAGPDPDRQIETGQVEIWAGDDPHIAGHPDQVSDIVFQRRRKP